MNILSLFDGISCCRVALERANIPVDKYYSSEIDKHAITIAQKNYPNTVQLGDVTKWQSWNIDFASIDIVTAGFPCQAWSTAGKQLGDKDPRGALFWTTLDIISHIKKLNPNVIFLLENVKMKREFEEYITYHTEQALGSVNKYLINSALVSAQNRQRYYWTNVVGVNQPEDKGLLLRDIIEDGKVDRDKAYCIDANYYKGTNLQQYLKKSRRQIVFLEKEKSDFILRLASLKASIRKDVIKNNAPFPDNVEISVPAGSFIYTNHLGQNGKLYKEKAATLVCSASAHCVTDDLQIRKLTPIECERLQTLNSINLKMEVIFCLESARNFVIAVDKNPKLQKRVLSVEKIELKESVDTVKKSTSVKRVSIKHIAQEIVDMLILRQTKKCIQNKKSVLKSNACIAESKNLLLNQKLIELKEEISVIQNVFIDITEGKIHLHGKEEFLQKEQACTLQIPGEMLLSLFGNETTLPAKDVMNHFNINQSNNSTYTTLNRSNTKNLDVILAILYYFAKSVIDGYTLKKIKKVNFCFQMSEGYTFGISNSQRYKALGNGWTVDVIAHIFKHIDKSK